MASDTTIPTSSIGAPSEGECELARVLALLEGERAGAVTLSALRERGVKTPGQAIYTLQLAGYAIDRVSCTDAGGHTTLGYLLLGSPAPNRSTGPREVNGGGG